MKYLHTMVRVTDLDQSLRFYCDALGLREIRRYDSEQGRYTLVFLAAPGDESAQVELTYNWDPEQYGIGRAFGHLAYEVDDIYAACRRLMDHDVTINRPPRDGQRLAEEAVHVEQQLIRENVGCQDQFHAAFGGLNVIEFRKEGIKVRPVVISKEKLDLLDSSLLVFYTGQSRFASEIAKRQIDSTRERKLDRSLERMHRMVYDAERIISDERPGDMVRGLGEMLHEGWSLKKGLSDQISTTLADEMYARGMQAGAYGGKLAGAGGGGFLFFLVADERKTGVREALRGYLEVNFRFESEGSKIIYLAH